MLLPQFFPVKNHLVLLVQQVFGIKIIENNITSQAKCRKLYFSCFQCGSKTPLDVRIFITKKLTRVIGEKKLILKKLAENKLLFAKFMKNILIFKNFY